MNHRNNPTSTMGSSTAGYGTTTTGPQLAPRTQDPTPRMSRTSLISVSTLTWIIATNLLATWAAPHRTMTQPQLVLQLVLQTLVLIPPMLRTKLILSMLPAPDVHREANILAASTQTWTYQANPTSTILGNTSYGTTPTSTSIGSGTTGTNAHHASTTPGSGILPEPIKLQALTVPIYPTN